MTRSGTSPDGLPPLREVIARHDLRAKKSLGQNFLLDFNLTRRIARFAAPLEETTVFEVGPGPGGLTRALLIEGAAHVMAIERDERCLPVLHQISDHADGRLSVLRHDAMLFDWQDAARRSPGRKLIAANLPYGIATALLVNWLQTEPWPPWFAAMVLMFQKEVAERIVAHPDTKAYGRLAVLAQWRTQAKIVMHLPPEAFTPPPKVASAVVEFTPILRTGRVPSVAALGRVTGAAFGQRRKMLRAALKSLVANPGELLDAANIDQTQRAENLSVKEFARLAYIFEHSRAGR